MTRWRARRAGRGHRLRRPDRLGDGPAPALRVPRRQRAARSADDRAAQRAADCCGASSPHICSAGRVRSRRNWRLAATSCSPAASNVAVRRLCVRALHRTDVGHQRRRRRRGAGRFRSKPPPYALPPSTSFSAWAARRARTHCSVRAADEIHRGALAANALMDCCAGAVHALLTAARLPPHAIAAIGVHGQTIRHRPELGLHACSSPIRRDSRRKRNHGRRRLPQPRRRGRRAGRTARAGVSRDDLRLAAMRIASSSISAESPTSPTCRPTVQCAASIRARATRYSTHGASATPVSRSTATAHGRRPGNVIAELLAALRSRSVL